MLKDKLKSKKIVLALIILLLLGVLSYLALRNSPYFSTLGWETFAGDGYEFKHPKDWVMGERVLMNNMIIISPQSDPRKTIIAIEVRNNPNELPLEDWLNEKPLSDSRYKTRKDEMNSVWGGTYRGSDLYYMENEITVGGIKGINSSVVYKNGEPTNWRVIIIPKDKKIYIISAPKKGSEEDNIFNKMLSTFKFTNN